VGLESLDEELSDALGAVVGVAGITSPYLTIDDTGNVLNSYESVPGVQVAKFGTYHYSSGEEPVYGLRVQATNGTNIVQVGGGSSTGNAATQVEFYTAANHQTLTGTQRITLDSAGLLSLVNGTSMLLSTTSTFILANTSDQTTNYGKGIFRYNSNVLELGHILGGTGGKRQFKVGVGSTNDGALGRYLRFDWTGPCFLFNWVATSANPIASVGNGSSVTNTGGVQNVFVIDPTVNQSGVGGYTMLLVNPTESATGSGAKLLADFQVGGTSKASVDNTGKVVAHSYTTGSTTTATSAGTTTLTVASTRVQQFTGSTTHTCKLPTTGIVAGEQFFIVNFSSGDVTVQSSGANTITTVSSGVGKWFTTLVDTPTTAAHWKAV
jgi:hypothetical protein